MTVVPVTTEQSLSFEFWPVVVSVTVPPPNEPKVVPVGRVIVMALSAEPANAPVDDVVKPIVQGP